MSITTGPIEPDEDYGGVKWVEYKTEPGVKYSRTVRQLTTPWDLVERTDCFCCSCGDAPLYRTDPYCRCHGFGGRRPCEEHNMVGGYDESMFPPEAEESSVMAPLESVQAERQKNHEKKSALEKIHDQCIVMGCENLRYGSYSSCRDHYNTDRQEEKTGMDGGPW